MEDAALDRPHGNSQFLGNLIVVKSIEKHGKWTAEIVLQPGNGGLDVVNVDERGHRIVVVVLIGVQKELVLSLVDDGILETLPLVVVDEDVAHDRVQPPFDVRTLLEIVLVAQRFDKCLLNQIIGIFPVSGEAQGETGQKTLVRNQKVVELDSGHMFNVVIQRLDKI